MNDIIIGREAKDKDRLGNKGTVFLGKHYIKMGRSTSLSNNVYLDVTRSHVVFICGKRGGGKCLTGDSLVTMADGSLKTISSLEKQDIPVMSLNDDLRIDIKEKEGFFEREVSTILKVVLASGKEIKCTPEHPLLSFYGWEEAQDLTVGSMIATPKIVPVFGEVDLSEERVKSLAYSLSTNCLFDGKIGFEKKFLSIVEKISIPSEVFSFTKHKLALFLNRLISSSGTLKKDEDEWILSVKAKNKEICQGLQHLLLRFGVVSFRSLNNLTIKEENLYGFIQEVGLFGPFEEESSKAIRELPRFSRNLDTTEYVDEVAEFFDPSDWEKLGKKFTINNNVSKHAYKNKYANTKQKNFLDVINESDIFWDEVVKLQKIDKKTKVYDISVPETNNFLANDIIVHNSYTMGVIAEGVSDLPKEIKSNLSIIMLDTMGVYWTMKYANKQDKDLLEDWGLEGKDLDVQIFTPEKYHEEYKEKGVPTDYSFAIKASELSGQDWIMTFELKNNDPVAVLIERIVYEMQEEHPDYNIDDIIKKIEKDKDASKNDKNSAKNLFRNALTWGLFSDKGTPLNSIVKAGQVSVLDVSCYATMPGSWNVKNLVIGLVAQKLFVNRMIARKEEEYKEVHKSENPFSDDEVKQEEPLVWLVIDEAHEFLPVEGKTLATDPLVTILREGRQPGISLILATQQPGKIHTDVMTQSDTVIAHRITAKLDTEALGMLMQSYMRKGLVEELDNLPREKGAAIIFDDTNERMYPIRVRPRFTWHGGGSPSALKEVEK